MPNFERKALASTRELATALEQVRHELLGWEREIRRTLTRVEKGETFGSIVTTAEPAQRRQTVDAVIDSLLQIRHRTRSLVFAVAIDQGLSVSELARRWGISRALAARYLRDAESSRR